MAHPPLPSFPPEQKRYALITLAGLAALVAWDASGLDLWLAHLSATREGFGWRHHWLLEKVLHDDARHVVFALLVGLVAAIWWPLGFLRGLSRQRRVWLFAAVGGAMLLVRALKFASDTTCPWNLEMFGGLQPYVHHWASSPAQGQGPGQCFPAGHASGGFGWVAGFFAWPAGSATGRRWLACALAAGLVFGLAQQLRGAHFMSHTLWTAWLCWTWGWGLSLLFPDAAHAHPAG